MPSEHLDNRTFSAEDLKFLKPLITYYNMGGFQNAPIQVENAVDSLIMLLGE
jgi:hypothetical protein